MQTQRIAAVVVTYNRLPLLRRCLAALAACRAACPGAALDIWVVDNASTDGTAAALAAWQDPGLHYCNTGRNLGGAGGFAWGLRAAAAETYDFYWIMTTTRCPNPARWPRCWRPMPGWAAGTAGFPPARSRRRAATSP